MEREFHTRDGFIRDAAGRVRIFHGVNVSGRAKSPPFLPLADPALLDPLPGWGWNLVRLLLQWEAAEPEAGAYDDAYLGRMIDLARACAARGLWTIVDFHQDLYARHYGGDGAPGWALPPVPGGPRYTGRKWFLNYLRCGDLIAAEERFWRNGDGVQDRYLGMLAHVARRFAGVPGVLGYDLMNEPMGRPRRLRRFARDTLPVFYRRAIAAYRQGDPGRLAFIEPAPLAGLGLGSSLPPIRESGIVYAPHLYDPIAIATGGFRPPLATHARTVAKHAATARRVGAPLLIGELGVLNGHAGGRALLESQVSSLDARFVSWAAWHYDPSGEDWNDEDASLVTKDGRERDFMAPLVRPYAPAVAGRLTACRYDPRATRFNLRYVPSAACSESTEVVIPARCFRAGASIVVEGAAWRRDGASGERFFIDPDSRAPEVRVTVSG